MKRAFLTIFMVLILCGFALSQITVGKHYNVSDGLPSTTLYSILQDKKGVIWICTSNGVSCYDGNSFTNLGLKDGLTENEITIVMEDSKERKWFIPYGSHFSYYDRGKIVNKNNFALFNRKLDLSQSSTVLEDSHHTIWAIGTSLFKVQDSSIKEIVMPRNKPFTIYQTSDQQVRFIDNRGIFRLENDSVKYIIRTEASLEKQLITKKPNVMNGALFLDGKIIFYGEKQIFTEIKNDSIVAVKEWITGYKVNRMKTDKHNRLWVLTRGNGALCINRVTKDTLRFLPGKIVSDILIDSENNIWLTTLDDGLFKFNVPLVKVFNQNSGLSSNSIHSVHVSKDGEVYLGLDNSKSARIKDHTIHEFNIVKKGKGRILGIKSRNKNVYFSGDDGIFCYNSSTGKTKRILDTVSSCKSLSIKDSLLMIGNSSFGFIMNINNMSLYKRWRRRIRSICPYAGNSYLLGTVQGLFLYKDTLVPYTKNIAQLNAVINHIEVDADGIAWIATQNGGVVAFKDNNILVFNEDNGLLSNYCNHICVDNKQTILVSTNRGLNKISIKDWEQHSYSISGYTTDDGLPSNEINATCIYNDSIWIATSDGLAIIGTDFTSHYAEPSAFIKKIVTNDSLYINPSDIELPYSQNSMAIYFGGVSLSSANQLKFMYRLFPLEKKWNYSNTREIRYNNLEPGNYQFVIYAIHRNGKLLSKTASVVIRVQAPFWKTIWFYILIIVLFISATLALYFSNLRKYRIKSELKNQALQSEIKALRSQMNPHFIFNSLNSIQNLVFSNKKEDANRYLTEFADLMRTILNHSRKNFISITEEITFLKTYLNLEQLRLNNKFEFLFSHPDGLSVSTIEIPSMIIQPFVENAVIHGLSGIDYPGKLTIEFTLEDDDLFCVITDNGPGYLSTSSPIKSHHSVGLVATRERINALKESGMLEIEYKITDLSPFEKGTRVEILFKNVNEKITS